MLSIGIRWRILLAVAVIGLATSGEGQGPNYNPVESSLISKEKWDTRWKRKESFCIYVVMEYCETLASKVNMSCATTVTRKAAFFPLVDKLALIEVPGSFGETILRPDNPNLIPTAQVYLQLYAYNETTGEKWMLNSTKKHWAEPGGAYLVGAFTAWVNMSRGLPISIDWEEGCDECSCFGVNATNATPDYSFGEYDDNSATGTVKPHLFDCAPQQCIDSVCGVYVDDCTNTEKCESCTEKTCDLKIYLAWVGNDTSGYPFSSKGYIPSTFRRFGFTSSYKAAAGIEEQNIIFKGLNNLVPSADEDMKPWED